MIPKGETMNISCRVNHGPIASRTPVIFEPDELHPWPSGLVIPEKLLAVKQGKSSQIEIEVTNTTKHDILLPNRTVLGRIELVQSVTPVEVKFKEWPKALREHKLEREPTESKPQVTTSEPPPHIKGIDLGDLTEEQRKLAIDMLTKVHGPYSCMEGCLEGLRDEICTPYLDDVIVYSKSFTKHIEHLRKVLRRLGENGVKLKPRRCKLFRKEVSFLGRVVSADGYKLDPSGIAPVLNLAKNPPKTVGEVRQIIGLLGYYHKCIKDFSHIAKPIYDLLATKLTKEDIVKVRSHSRSKGKRDSGQLPSNHPINWTEEHQVALEHLTKHLTSLPVMAYPNFEEPFLLHTDASKTSLGSVLHQQQNGVLQVIAYGSHTISPSERNYHLHSGKLEFLALRWSICEHFQDYLY